MLTVVVAAMSGKEADAKGPEWTVESELRAFKSIPAIDTRTARRLLPDLVEVCEMLGNTQSLEWDAVCVAWATVVCQLSPRDIVEICESVEVPGSLWTTLLHPGSVNTSGLLKVISRAMEIVYYRQHASEVDAAKAAHKAECDRLKSEAADPEKVKLPVLVLPPRRKGLAGGGSLAAGGFEASKPHNRDSMTAVEPELEGILAWLLAEFAFDAAVPAKLWDGTTWDRPVMNAAKAFTMYRPFFSFCAGGHLYELLKRLLKDLIGLRQRLTVKYARPLFLEIGDIRKACKLLPLEVEYKPANFLASLMQPLLVRSLEKEAAVVDSENTPAGCTLGSVFKPSGGDGAMEIVDAKFNLRNNKQKGCYLQAGSHHMSKYHGKLKTKYDRMLLGIHFANALSTHFLKMRRKGVGMDKPEYTTDFEFPSPELPKPVVEFTYLLADHCEMTWAKLDLSRSMEEMDVDETTLADGMEQRTTSATQLGMEASQLGVGASPSTDDVNPHQEPASKRRKLEDPVAFLKDLKGKLSTGCVGSTLREDAFNNLMRISASEWKELFSVPCVLPSWDIVKAAMRTHMFITSSWVLYSERSMRPLFQKVAPDNACFGALVAAALLTLLDAGQLVLSSATSGGGKRMWYFVKRPLAVCTPSAPELGCQQQVDFDAVRLLLEHLGFTHSSTPSLAACVSTTTKKDKPAGTPDVSWAPCSLASLEQVVDAMKPFGGDELAVAYRDRLLAASPGATSPDALAALASAHVPMSVSASPATNSAPDLTATDVEAVPAAPENPHPEVDVAVAPPAREEPPPELDFAIETNPAEECACVRLLVVPAIGSCIYTCIALSKSSSDTYYEWTCVCRHANGVAKDQERVLSEQRMARDIASQYKADVDPEHTPDSDEYAAIAVALSVTLDVHFFYSGDFVHFRINPGCDHVRLQFSHPYPYPNWV